jgi:hypothetical protein
VPVLRVAKIHRLWSGVWRRHRGTITAETTQASTTAKDFAHGLELYRANVFQRLRHPVQKRTDTPVQIIVPTMDHYITPSLLNGLESWSSLVWRRDVAAGHWIIHTHPVEIAAWIGQVIAFVENGTEAEELARCRIASTGDGAWNP